jgi:hypothetical protein
VRHFEAIRAFFAEHLTEQASISLVILNQKNSQGLFFHERASLGNLTTDDQKTVDAPHHFQEPLEV